jgi:hypothetical protein
MITAQDVIHRLQLAPLTIEGGYFRETYRSKLAIPAAALPGEYGGERNVATAIYYLLTPESFAAIHRVRSDEVFHFYAGDPVEMLQLHGDLRGETIAVGNDLAAGQRPQVVVPAGVWQGCRLAAQPPSAQTPSCGWALLGCTVAPGFDYADFTAGDRAELSAAYPKYAKLIEALTPR